MASGTETLLLIFIFDVAACSYRSRVVFFSEKHQLPLSSRARKKKKKSLSAGSRGVLIA